MSIQSRVRDAFWNQFTQPVTYVFSISLLLLLHFFLLSLLFSRFSPSPFSPSPLLPSLLLPCHTQQQHTRIRFFPWLSTSDIIHPAPVPGYGNFNIQGGAQRRKVNALLRAYNRPNPACIIIPKPGNVRRKHLVHPGSGIARRCLPAKFRPLGPQHAGDFGNVIQVA